MALRIHLSVPNPFQIIKTPKTNHYPSTAHLNYPTPKLQFSISCSKKSDFSDTELASKFAREADRINFQKLQREDALNKSRELLFKELCSHMEMENEEAKKKWRRMSEDDKWVLVKGFVSKWGADFHPLSEKSVKEFLDEYILEQGSEFAGGSASNLISGFKKLIGFPPNDDE